ncbi:hypothetical protein BCR44DRAFT_1021683 [Catenaria anguillulae PL171]|uniref:Uncharacterized protein n=1 Tax=Catenaria anguillulae PL171 TaxID=765915 RepID=A0A1Y2H6A0_9FUNG|nr:hypothetical protein BCR44DRAFT_1021683 [Catenaria anguillulae PL171]
MPCGTAFPELHEVVSLLYDNSVSLVDIANHRFFASRSRSALRQVGHKRQQELERRMAVAQARMEASTSKCTMSSAGKRKVVDDQAVTNKKRAAVERASPPNK